MTQTQDLAEYEQILEELSHLDDQIRELAGRRSLSDSDETRLAALRSRVDVLNELRREHERAALAAPGLIRESGNTAPDLDDIE